MAKSASCKCKPAECEECPEWIFTFADLVMLMMGFFVILWVLKPSGNPSAGSPGDMAQSEEYRKVAGEIRAAFGHIPDPTSNDPIDIQMLVEQMRKMNGPGEKGKTKVESRGAEGTDPEVTNIRPANHATVGTRIIFERGTSSFGPETNAALDEIVLQIRGHRNIVLVKGHTSRDDLPDTATVEQKMDLSLRRAQAVADYLTRRGVEPEILRVQGCSTFEPVVQRAYTADAQANNRRVEVEATATLVEELQDNKPRPATSQPAAPEH